MKELYRAVSVAAVLAIVVVLASCTVLAGPAKSVGSPAATSQPTAATTPAPEAASGPFDVNVSIVYRITLDDKVKDTDPNIIRAARQAMFDFDSNNAHHAHYRGYSVNYDFEIFEVDKQASDTWEVRFWEKTQDMPDYTRDGYCFATVTKQPSGSYVGSMINPGGLMIRGDETY